MCRLGTLPRMCHWQSTRTWTRLFRFLTLLSRAAFWKKHTLTVTWHLYHSLHMGLVQMKWIRQWLSKLTWLTRRLWLRNTESFDLCQQSGDNELILHYSRKYLWSLDIPVFNDPCPTKAPPSHFRQSSCFDTLWPVWRVQEGVRTSDASWQIHVWILLCEITLQTFLWTAICEADISYLM